MSLLNLGGKPARLAVGFCLLTAVGGCFAKPISSMNADVAAAESVPKAYHATAESEPSMTSTANTDAAESILEAYRAASTTSTMDVAHAESIVEAYLATATSAHSTTSTVDVASAESVLEAYLATATSAISTTSTVDVASAESVLEAYRATANVDPAATSLSVHPSQGAGTATTTYAQPPSPTISAGLAAAGPVKPKTEALGKAGFFNNMYKIRGAGWDPEKFNGKKGKFGGGLHKQLKGCSLFTWHLKRLDPLTNQGFEWEASGATGILQEHCVNHAMMSAGAPDDTHDCLPEHVPGQYRENWSSIASNDAVWEH